MALNLEAVGQRSEALIHEYGWKDVVLYALGVGARRDGELDYLFEDRGPKVLPTYAVVPSFAAIHALLPVIGGDLLGVVHGDQAIRQHRPFAPEGRLVTRARVAGIYDLKRLAICNLETESHDEDGALICETEWGIIFRNDGGFGGPRPPKAARNRPPAREPDFRVEEATSTEQALLYRLSGDLNPLHADPAIGEKVGFGQPILHGLCTYGYVGRVLLRELCAGDPSRLVSLSGQFRKPVFPGDRLIVEGWIEGRTVFVSCARAEKPEEPVFSAGLAELAE
ncbi:MAG: MaoC/PaaZ C-terminal domain-containing protein [Myxococcales bacterium]|nr:MaoC/PaaZ C-terminal domain-containing protein [Myxococcales bacterium]